MVKLSLQRLDRSGFGIVRRTVLPVQLKALSVPESNSAGKTPSAANHARDRSVQPPPAMGPEMADGMNLQAPAARKVIERQANAALAATTNTPRRRIPPRTDTRVMMP